VIVSFLDGATEDLYHGTASARVRRFPQDVATRALDKLAVLDAATDVNDLRVPPGNHLEQLKGDLAGCWSIRVNQQWRIVFKWEGGNATEVRLVDYH
jgi:toxin HigB-1